MFPPSIALKNLQTPITKLLRAARLVILQHRTQIPLEDEVQLIFKSCTTLKHKRKAPGDSTDDIQPTNHIENIVTLATEAEKGGQMIALSEDNILSDRRRKKPTSRNLARRPSLIRSASTVQREELIRNTKFYLNAPGDPLQVAKHISSSQSEESEQVMTNTIKNARNESFKLTQHMETLRTDDEKGVFLVQQFLVNCVAGK